MKVYQEVQGLRKKYARMIPNAEIWNGNDVIDFFDCYKPLLTEMFLEYPGFYFKGIRLFPGLDEEQLPFEKELIQAKLYNLLFSSDIVLLPRYIDRILLNILGVDLRKGSLGDGLAAYDNKGKYVEFKLCNDKKLPQRISKAAGNADEFFICVEDLKDETIRKLGTGRLKMNIPKGTEGSIFALNSHILYSIRSDEHIQIQRRKESLDETSSNVLIQMYSAELMTINRDASISFAEYLDEESKSWNEYTFLLYGGDISIPRCLDEYRRIRGILARRNIRAVIPKSSLISLFDFPFTGVIEFISETRTVFCMDVSARTFADIRGLQYLKISNTELFLT